MTAPPLCPECNRHMPPDGQCRTPDCGYVAPTGAPVNDRTLHESAGVDMVRAEIRRTLAAFPDRRERSRQARLARKPKRGRPRPPRTPREAPTDG